MEKRIKKMKKISIVGPESSGKTTLAVFLSKILKGIYVNEYARDYLNKNKNYTINHLDIFATFSIPEVPNSTIKLWIVTNHKRHLNALFEYDFQTKKLVELFSRTNI